MRLGRLPHNPLAVALAPQLAAHRFGAFAPPPKLDRSHIDYQPGLFRNDVLPDCSAAGIVNAASAASALNGSALAIDPATVPPFYALCAGCEATDAAMEASDGAVLIEVLQRQLRDGFPVGTQTPLVARFAVVRPDRIALANAMVRFGSVYAGVTLHQAEMEWPAVWDLGDSAVVGGHCVVFFDYTGLGDADTVRVATWGMLQDVTWRFIEERTDEAYVLLFGRELARADGIDLGVSDDQLDAELAAMVA